MIPFGREDLPGPANVVCLERHYGVRMAGTYPF